VSARSSHRQQIGLDDLFRLDDDADAVEQGEHASDDEFKCEDHLEEEAYCNEEDEGVGEAAEGEYETAFVQRASTVGQRRSQMQRRAERAPTAAAHVDDWHLHAHAHGREHAHAEEEAVVEGEEEEEEEEEEHSEESDVHEWSPLVALVGRVNSGKSTLFNSLTESSSAIVSSVSGTTRDRCYGRFQLDYGRAMLVDTGGLCGEKSDPFAGKIEEQVDVALQVCVCAMCVSESE
jgi:GTPase